MTLFSAVPLRPRDTRAAACASSKGKGTQVPTPPRALHALAMLDDVRQDELRVTGHGSDPAPRWPVQGPSGRAR